MICVFKQKELQGLLKKRKCQHCTGSDIKCIHFYNQQIDAAAPPDPAAPPEENNRPDWIQKSYLVSGQAIYVKKRILIGGWLHEAPLIDNVFKENSSPAAEGDMGAPPRTGGEFSS